MQKNFNKPHSSSPVEWESEEEVFFFFLTLRGEQYRDTVSAVAYLAGSGWQRGESGGLTCAAGTKIPGEGLGLLLSSCRTCSFPSWWVCGYREWALIGGVQRKLWLMKIYNHSAPNILLPDLMLPLHSSLTLKGKDLKTGILTKEIWGSQKQIKTVTFPLFDELWRVSRMCKWISRPTPYLFPWLAWLPLGINISKVSHWNLFGELKMGWW